MTISALEIFKIGIGPSSSHTMGPMRAGGTFLQELGPHLQAVTKIRIELFGSLAATGVGHGTDRAVVGGLLGFMPDTCCPDAYADAIAKVTSTRRLALGGGPEVPFDWSSDLIFEPQALPLHPNALTITAEGPTGVLHRNTYYSIGGGFIVDQAHAETTSQTAEPTPVEFGFDTAAELLRICADTGLNIAQVVARNEGTWREESDWRAGLLNIWSVMESCIQRGLRQEGVLPGGLQVPRRAPGLYRHLNSRDAVPNLITQTFSAMDWVNLFALAVNEENAGGGRVVTAPTNGAAGVIPAVLAYFMRYRRGANDDDVVDFLLAAAAVAWLLKKNASISGAEVGCQGEVGSACAMAAAGLTQVLGGSPAQVENAAEIGLEHNLGLTCDPVGGLVQVPCIERNAMAAVKAINAAQLALSGDGHHRVSLDAAIVTMRETGKDMLSKYKETSTGGLAVAFTEC